MIIWKIFIEKVFLNKHGCRSYGIIWRSIIFPFGLECCYHTATFSLLQEAGRIEKYLHWRFSIAILAAVRTGFTVFPQPFIQIILQHLNRFVDLFLKNNLIEFRENRFMKSLADSIRLRRFCFRFCMIYVLQVEIKFRFYDVLDCCNIPICGIQDIQVLMKGFKIMTLQNCPDASRRNKHPSLRNSLETLCCPKAVLSSTIFTTRDSISGSTQFLGFGLFK